MDYLIVNASDRPILLRKYSPSEIYLLLIRNTSFALKNGMSLDRQPTLMLVIVSLVDNLSPFFSNLSQTAAVIKINYFIKRCFFKFC